MKKLILILLTCLLANFACAETVGIFKVADDTTAFGKIKAANTLIFNVSTGEFFKLTAKASAIDTLSTVSTGDLVTSSPPLVSYMGSGVISWTGSDILAINADDTKFDIAAMDLLFIDKTDPNPDNHTKQIASCSIQTAVAATHLLTSVGTWIGYDSSCTIIQSPTEFTPEQRNNIAQIGRLGHFGKTVITGTFDLVWVYETLHNWAIEKAATGTTRLAGATVTANGANLKIDRSLGRFLRIGAGSARDVINYPQSPAAVQVSMIPAYNSATGEGVLGSATTDIDILQYDDLSGTLQSVGAGQYANIFIYHFPYKAIVTTFFLYGNEQYSSLADAEIGVLNKKYTIPSDMTGGTVIAGISVLKETTDLAAAITGGTASITEPPFGGGGGGVSVSLWDKVGVDLLPATPTDNIKLTGNIQLGAAIIEQDNTTHAPVYSSGQSGLDDLSSSGLYSLSGSAVFQAKIQSIGSPNDFEWRKGSVGAWSSPVAMTGSAQLLQDGISVTWGVTSGHTLNDTWEIHVGEEIHIDSTTHVEKDLIVTGDIIAVGNVRSLSPVKLLDGIRFISKITGDSEFHQYISGTDSAITPLPSAFDGALIFKTNVGSNPSDMDAVFWDAINSRPSVVINQGGTGRTSVFERSLVVGAQKGAKALDGSYTMGTTDYPKLDFNTSTTGADLGVENDVQILGTLYVDTINESTMNMTTGWLWGGEVTINAGDNTKIDITAGAVQIVSGTDKSVAKIISWTAQIALDPVLATRSTWVGVKDDGFGVAEFVYDTKFDAVERRSTAILARIWDSGGSGPQITNVGDYERPAWGILTAFQDFILEYGSWNIEGNIITANGANLLLDKSAGKSYRYHSEDAIGQENVHTDAAHIPRNSYAYHLQGNSTTTGKTMLDPDNRDNGAGGTVAVGNNKFTRQRIFVFPVSGSFHVIYGQIEYGSMTEAEDASAESMNDVNLSIIDGSYPAATVIMKKGVTDLVAAISAGNAKIVPPGVAGGAGGGATSYWKRTGTDLSPVIAGDDVLLSTGETLSIADMTQGSIPFFGASGVLSQDNANLFWDDTNNRLGIGTANPSTLLEVNSPSSHTFFKLNTTAADLVSNLEFFNNDVHKWSLSSEGAKDAPNDRLTVYNASAATEVMTFLQNGKVGVGVNDPKSALHIKANTPGTVGSSPAGQMIIQSPGISDNSNAVITGYASDVAGEPSQQLWYLGSSSSSNSDVILLNRLNSSLSLGTNGASRLTIDENGNVAIGTGTPTAPLDINGDTIRLRTAKTPASAGAACNQGDMAWDANYTYNCVAANTWKRAALSTW